MRLRKIFMAVMALSMAVVMAVRPMEAAAYDRQPAQIELKDVWFENFDKGVNGGEPVRGVDISSVISLEKAGIDFYNERGEKQDIFRTLADNGVNYIRVRIWNEPRTSSGQSYGGGNCDVSTAAEIGRRAARYGMKLLADFQYSDFWADPEKQTVPKAWRNLDHNGKKQAIYDFTKRSLRTIAEAGADIGMVQVGNETNCFFCGEKDMYKICDLFSAGCAAVREFDRKVMIALHFANPATGYYDWYAKVLNECRVDYDVFATSYYPYWHGTTENLTSVLRTIGNTYNKYVMVAETAYPYTSEDGDTFGNAVSAGSQGAELRYDISVEGQARCLTDVFRAVASVGSRGIGVFYWEPAWIGKSGLSWEEQKRLWEEYGSGWATGYAGEYDKSADKTGGSSYDNQGLFDFRGAPLDSLKVFSHIFPQSKRIEYQDGRYIKNLRVNDKGNAGDWSVRTGLRANDKVFGDRDFEYTSIPDFLIGAEWIRTACNSKLYGREQAEFTAGGDITVYVGIDTRITEELKWLGGWKATEHIVKDNGSPQVSYRLYRKDCKKGEPVVLGAVGASYAVNYFAAAVEYAPEKLLGDADGDGRLTVSDVKALQSWLLKSSGAIDGLSADMNRDGKVNVFDLCLLKRKVMNR